MDVIDVDWSSLLPKQPKEPKEPGAALLKFTPGAILLRAGISKRLAGAELFAKVNETCRAAINNSKGMSHHLFYLGPGIQYDLSNGRQLLDVILEILLQNLKEVHGGALLKIDNPYSAGFCISNLLRKFHP